VTELYYWQGRMTAKLRCSWRSHVSAAPLDLSILASAVSSRRNFSYFSAQFAVTKKGKNLLFDPQQPVSLQADAPAGQLVQ